MFWNDSHVDKVNEMVKGSEPSNPWRKHYMIKGSIHDVILYYVHCRNPGWYPSTWVGRAACMCSHAATTFTWHACKLTCARWPTRSAPTTCTLTGGSSCVPCAASWPTRCYRCARDWAAVVPPHASRPLRRTYSSTIYTTSSRITSGRPWVPPLIKHTNFNCWCMAKWWEIFLNNG